MDVTMESFSCFFANIEPAFFGYLASHFTIREFVAVYEAFTSCSIFRQVWHSKIKGIMRRTWPLIQDESSLYWILDRGIDARDWDLKFPDCKQGGESFTKLCVDGEWRLVITTMERTLIDVNVSWTKPIRRDYDYDSWGAHDTTAMNFPLHFACKAGVLDVCKLLLQKGADKEAKNSFGRTPIHGAASNDHLDVVEYLVEHGVNKEAVDNDNSTPLHFAASDDHLDVVKYLVEQGVNKEVVDDDDETPLHIAASNDHLDLVKYLVEHGANKEAVDNGNQTPLYDAASNAHLYVVEYLVEQGVNKEAVNNNNQTPLYIAASNDHLDIVKYLVEKGGNTEVRDAEGLTPLLKISRDNDDWVHNNAIECLLTFGLDVDVNATDSSNCTALHYETIRGNLDAVKYLVRSGANVNAANEEGKTPVSFCDKRDEIAKFLIENGAIVSQCHICSDEDIEDDLGQCQKCGKDCCRSCSSFCEHCMMTVCSDCGYDYCEDNCNLVCKDCGTVTWREESEGYSFSFCTLCP